MTIKRHPAGEIVWDVEIVDWRDISIDGGWAGVATVRVIHHTQCKDHARCDGEGCWRLGGGGVSRRTVQCPHCRGSGEMAVCVPCDTCRGAGVVPA